MSEGDQDSPSCPLCLEELDATDKNFHPCPCGYQICAWCWHQLMEIAAKDSKTGRCPACRTEYKPEDINFTAPDPGDLPKKAKKKATKPKNPVCPSINRKNLANVRVIQRNLVYVIGLSLNICRDEILKRPEYFGKYGKIVKVSVNRSGVYNSAHGGATGSAYVTYVREEDALKCIQNVEGNVVDGKVIRCSFGTTKYCNAFLKNQPCNNPDCLYLHDLGNEDDSFTKEEMIAKDENGCVMGSAGASVPGPSSLGKHQLFMEATHPGQIREDQADHDAYTMQSYMMQHHMMHHGGGDWDREDFGDDPHFQGEIYNGQGFEGRGGGSMYEGGAGREAHEEKAPPSFDASQSNSPLAFPPLTASRSAPISSMPVGDAFNSASNGAPAWGKSATQGQQQQPYQQMHHHQQHPQSATMLPPRHTMLPPRSPSPAALVGGSHNSMGFSLHGGGSMWGAGGPFAPVMGPSNGSSHQPGMHEHNTVYGSSPISHMRSNSIETGGMFGESFFAQPSQSSAVQGLDGFLAANGVAAGHEGGGMQHPTTQARASFSLGLGGYGGLPTGGVPGFGTQGGPFPGAVVSDHQYQQQRPQHSQGMCMVGSDLLKALTRSASASSMGGYSPYAEMGLGEGSLGGGGLLGSAGEHPLANSGYPTPSPVSSGSGASTAGEGVGARVPPATSRWPQTRSRFQFARDDEGVVEELPQPAPNQFRELSNPQDVMFFRSLLPNVDTQGAAEGTKEGEVAGLSDSLRGMEMNGGLESSEMPGQASGSSLLFGMRPRQGSNGSRVPPPGFSQVNGNTGALPTR